MHAQENSGKSDEKPSVQRDPVAASDLARASADSASSTTRLPSIAVMSAWS